MLSVVFPNIDKERKKRKIERERKVALEFVFAFLRVCV